MIRWMDCVKEDTATIEKRWDKLIKIDENNDWQIAIYEYTYLFQHKYSIIENGDSA